ncbi:hypothetical protein N7470_001239 [Penicillium chermesinum]|nr:hypothetical protein N7470_001239 [Penicillium chermesinum]
MFAVPGWSVPTSAPKQETEKSQGPSDSKSKDSSAPNAKNKRKRGNDNVNSRNVDEMYRKHIVGEKPIKPWQKEKKEKRINGNPEGAKDTQPPKPSDENEDIAGPKKKQKKNKKNKTRDPVTTDKDTAAKENAPPASSEATASAIDLFGASPTYQAMRQKLVSSRFRHLNETLYTTDSSKAVELFNANPELFSEYHAGFARQVKESWPSNPVDGYIQFVRRRGAVPVPKRGSKPQPNRPQPLPRRPNGACTIADLGCGDAALARALTPSAKKLNLKLLSYDLQAPDPLITKADISNLPVEDGSVDVAIFCLSLMGTNWVSFVEEAWRVLRGDGKGECWVSEVKSRFGKVNRKKAQIGAQKPMSKSEQKKLKQKKKTQDNADSDLDDAEIYAEDARPSDNKDETDISAFVEVFRTRGFVLRPESVDKSNKMFVKMEFVKQGGAPTKGKYAGVAAPTAGKKRFVERKPEADSGMSPAEEAQVLKPCVYKIR